MRITIANLLLIEVLPLTLLALLNCVYNLRRSRPHQPTCTPRLLTQPWIFPPSFIRALYRLLACPTPQLALESRCRVRRLRLLATPLLWLDSQARLP
jgi:hypothetical protein